MEKDNNVERIGPHHYVGIFLLSLATLLLELSLTRVLSVALWYHFGFLIISTALLGYRLYAFDLVGAGAGCVALALVMPRCRRRSAKTRTRYLLADACQTRRGTMAICGRPIALKKRANYAASALARACKPSAGGLQNFSNDTILPAFARVDATAFYERNANDKTRLRFAVNLQNLTNRRYYDSSTSFASLIFPGAPLTVLGSFRITRR